jgi:hypothetical protein
MHRRTRRQRHHHRQPLQFLGAHSCQLRQSAEGRERRTVVEEQSRRLAGFFGRAAGVLVAVLCSVDFAINNRCEGGNWGDGWGACPAWPGRNGRVQ